jgi:hypothetical protein
MPLHLLSVRAPPHLPRMAVCVTDWPIMIFGTSCIPSDDGDYMRLVIAVCPASRDGGKTWPGCPSVPGCSFLPVLDWLSTSFKYVTHSANLLSVSTQVDLSFQCGITVGLFLPRSMSPVLLPLVLLFPPEEGSPISPRRVDPLVPLTERDGLPNTPAFLEMLVIVHPRPGPGLCPGM